MTSATVTVDEHEDGLVSLRLTGELDLANTTEIREQILGALPNEVVGAVLDLTAVDYLDSAAIRLIFEVARAMGEHGQQLRVAVTPGSIPSEVIGHVGLAQSVPVHPDAAVALDELRAASRPPG